MRRELIGDFRPRPGIAENIAARDIHIVGQGQRDRVARHRLGPVAVRGDDPRNGGEASGSRHRHRIAGPDRAAGDSAGEAAEIEIWAVDPLHRKPEGRGDGRRIHVHPLQMRQQGRPVIPGGIWAAFRDIVAEPGRKRDRDLAGKIQLLREGRKIRDDFVKNSLRKSHQIDLVHRQHHMPDAEQRCDIGVPAGLGEDALAGIDQDHRQVAVGGAGRHVAGILLMARRVGDDEFALVGGEVAISDIDGDALLPFRLQPVHQQREIDVFAGGSEFAGVPLQRRQRVVEQKLGVV